MTTKTRRIGPRMRQLCWHLAQTGGTSPSQSALYLQLSYHGGESNQYGSRALARAMGAGLIEVDPKAAQDAPGNRTPIRLTATGREVAGS
jgi:hypothetical protein